MASSMQKKIPPEIREKLSQDPFMTRCCIADETCQGRIEWNHHFQFAGRRMNDPWGILPMCTSHHRREAQFRDRLDIIMVSRATEEELAPYCKAKNYVQIKRNNS